MYALLQLPTAMAPRKKTSTTRLPQSLQEQLQETTANDHPQTQRHRRSGSRKELRKQERAVQKQKKAEYFSHNPNHRKRAADDEHTDSPKRKKVRQNDSDRPHEAKTKTQSKATPQENQNASSGQISSRQTTSGKPSKSLAKTLEPSKHTKKISVLPKDPQEEKEDSYIAYLEAQLGLGKSGRKKKSKEEDDGLDDLMDWADSFVARTTLKNKYPEPTSEDDEDGNVEDDNEGSILHSSVSESDSAESDDYGEEWGGIANDNLDSETEEDSKEPCKKQLESDTKPAATGVYIPPHLRNAQKSDKSDSEHIQKLTKQLKGLLNRMSEQNIGSIVDSVEEIYREHRRNDVTSTLTTLILHGISTHSSLLDSYVVLYAAFVSSLHKIIGIEFAAHFVQTLVLSYEQQYSKISSTTDVTELEGKECSNLLVLISELYNFQVISSLLLFDVIRALLAGDLTEYNVELLLKVVRNSGQQLRQDDPSALKDIIQIVQGRVSTEDEGISSRTRFMIETLTNLKNNKLKRNVTQNQGGAAVERLKKFLSGLSKSRHILAHEPLRVSLEDLHTAETKGKWWLVGAAWSGDPLVDKQAELSKSTTANVEKEEVVPSESADLIKLARSQGMNTDVRRGIFIVLMSSDDYIDACERLSQLNLTEVQQREIVRVLLHCCGNEKAYNPYYTLVCQQLCRTSHAYKITLQFSLWDFLRDLGEKTVGGAAVIKNIDDSDDFDVKNISDYRLRNVARAYAWWIAKDCVTLLVLKPVDFTTLKPRTRDFLTEVFTHIFVNSQRSTPVVLMDVDNLILTRNRATIEEIFIKATRVQALAMGLVYFLSAMSKEASATDADFSKFLRWAVSVAKDTLRTGVDAVSVL
ncbi:hypothetical protein BDN70DRAFT_848385 [Pholiota conissans]|uniref:MI domain-containing protein n=1 Tax=Pholiota conissans TaxID=109636 RepID=A0A9P5ZEU9_9AGAR|nr:hypothetical protein BDN70DRAFT_848385 [Pholiota conissans]